MPIHATDAAEGDGIELKMTSMIDVVFLLLIFFIVTLRIPQEEAMIETELPQAAGPGQATAREEERQEFEDILLTLRKDPDTGHVRTYVSGQRMMTPEQLNSRLQMFRNINESGRVVVQCQDEVPYQELVMAISVVQNVELPMAFADLD